MSDRYVAGKSITSLDELMKAIDDTGFVIVSGEVVHRLWVISCRIDYLLNLINAGLIQWAKRKEEAKP